MQNLYYLFRLDGNDIIEGAELSGTHSKAG